MHSLRHLLQLPLEVSKGNSMHYPVGKSINRHTKGSRFGQEERMGRRSNLVTGIGNSLEITIRKVE